MDPENRVTSTLHVPDQRWDVNRAFLHEAIVSLTSLPSVVAALITDYAKIGFTLKEALKYRQELMRERKYFVDAQNNAWQREYSLCEH